MTRSNLSVICFSLVVLAVILLLTSSGGREPQTDVAWMELSDGKDLIRSIGHSGRLDLGSDFVFIQPGKARVTTSGGDVLTLTAPITVTYTGGE